MSTTKVRTPGDTSKSKRSLGIPDDQIITWTAFANDYRDNNILKALAKKRGVVMDLLMAPILREYFDSHRDELTAEADEFLTHEKTIEDLQKELQRSLNLSKRLEEILSNRTE